MLIRWWLALLALGVFTGCRWGFEPVGSDDGPVIGIVAGALHTCALLTDGRVRCWGFNGNGELGSGSTDETGEGGPSATDVDIGAPVKELAAGRNHTCALIEGGHVRCWGSNVNGQLGYPGKTLNRPPSEAPDVPLAGTVMHVAAGGLSTCVLLDTGAVRCWGSNSLGQLGYGNTDEIDDVAEVLDLELGGTATKIAVGGRHACALLDTHRVRCWGNGTSGRLGQGNTLNIGDDETPASRPTIDVGGDIVEIAAGAQHTCAILMTGAVRCWGSGEDGRLGYGDPSNIGDKPSRLPVSVGDVPLGGIAIQIAVGDRHTCALLDTDAVRCWGSGEQGRLGYANPHNVGDTEENVPGMAGDVNVGGPVTQLATGPAHTCVVVAGNVRCWGAASHGRLGYGDASIVIGDDEVPASRPAIQLSGPAEQITVGRSHACARLTDGNVVCWGKNTDGQSGNPTREAIGDDETPEAVGPVALGGFATQIAAGAEHTCARLRTDDTVRCWGSGQSGRLGYGNEDAISDPGSVPAVQVGAKVSDIALGTNHTCAVITGGAVRCWGRNSTGQLGYPTKTIGDVTTPALVGDVDVDGEVRQLALGSNRTCALLTNGTVRCWGDNSDGALGYGQGKGVTYETPAMSPAIGFELPVTQLAYGGSHACALLEGGTVRCWGSNSNGQLGYGNKETIGDGEMPASRGPVDVGGAVKKLAAGTSHTCALLERDRSVRCWGLGAGGRLGYANTDTIGDEGSDLPLIARPVDIGGTALDIAAGESQTCALLSDHTVRCWGDDHGFGVLGQAIVNNIGDDEAPASVGDVVIR